MQAQIKLGRVAGILVGLHYSWFIIAALITLSLSGHFHTVAPGWSDAVVWSAAIITGLLFFVALLAHEMAHSLVAKAYGLKVRSITLFALGGVSQIESEASDAKSEFWIAIVGPLSSLVIGFALLLVARLSGWLPGTDPATPVMAVLLWLGYINIMLAAFNMVPGYPLDGGRVLRALIWWITHNADRATRLAAQVGQAVDVGLRDAVVAVPVLHRVGPRPAERQPQERRLPEHVGHEVGHPERVAGVEEFRRPNRQRIDRAHVARDVVFRLQRQQARGDHVGVGRAEGPVEVVGQGHGRLDELAFIVP